MYIMCVCLFSALSRRVGALQISIIIINVYVGLNRTGLTRSVNGNMKKTAADINTIIV